METINQQLAHALKDTFDYMKKRIKEQDKQLENAENTYYVIKGELDNANKRIKELEANEQAMNDAHCKLMDKVEAAKPKWISVKDSFPEINKLVLVSIYGSIFIDAWNGKYWQSNCIVSHWMPFPPPPTEESTETEKEDK